jgi:hypothetical protein
MSTFAARAALVGSLLRISIAGFAMFFPPFAFP